MLLSLLYTVFILPGTRLRAIEKKNDYLDDYMIHLLIGIGKLALGYYQKRTDELSVLFNLSIRKTSGKRENELFFVRRFRRKPHSGKV